MNRMFKYAMVAVSAAALAPTAFSQTPPDVPDDHWAYRAVQELFREGILVGYPDGLFRGNRPASRYELAQALWAAYTRLTGLINGLSSQVDALERTIDGMEGGGGGVDNTADLNALRNQLNELEERVDGMESWGDDIEAMQRMATEFERELAELGVDVESMKNDLADLEDRVTALEEEESVEIFGDINILVLAGHGDDDTFGLTPGGKVLGLAGDPDSSYDTVPTGVVRDLNVFHEIALGVRGEVNENVDFQLTLVAGNTLDDGNDGLGSYSQPSFDDLLVDDFDIHIYDAYVNWNTGLLGQGLDAKIGRVNHSVGPYLFARNSGDTDFLYVNERWNNENYIFDGGVFDFEWGSVDLTVFGGAMNGVDANDVSGLNPISLVPGASQSGVEESIVRSLLGVTLGFEWGDDDDEMDEDMGEEAGVDDDGSGGELELAYLWLDTNELVTAGFGDYNRLNVYGAQVGWNFGDIDLWGSYAATTLSENTDEVLDDDNIAFHGHVGWSGDNFGIGGGFRSIEGNFLAPGDWGNVGSFFNPTNVEGFYVNGYFNISDEVELNAWYEQLEGKDTPGGFVGNGANVLSPDDNLDSFGATAAFGLTSNWGVEVGASMTEWNFDTGTEPSQNWYWVGLNHDLGDGAFARIGYMYSDVNNEGRDIVLFPGRAFTGLTGDFQGGLITTQVTVRF